MEFKLLIDKYYLILKMISNRNDIAKLNEWKKSVIMDILGVELIQEIESRKEDIEEFFIRGEFNQFILENDLDEKFMEIMKDHLFRQYYNETFKYLNLINNTWLKVKNQVNRWLKEVIKVKTIKEPMTVYLSHPSLNTGKCVDQKYVFWGHWKGIEDVNYNITYLCHETLHSLLPNPDCMPPAMKLYLEKDENVLSQEHWEQLNALIENYYQIYDFEYDLIHTIIELISDNELYTLLNGYTQYSNGHKSPEYSLVKYKKLILPYWFEYLNLSLEEIQSRIPNFTNKNNNLLKDEDKTNIESFLIFLLNNPIIRENMSIPKLIIKE